MIATAVLGLFKFLLNQRRCPLQYRWNRMKYRFLPRLRLKSLSSTKSISMWLRKRIIQRGEFSKWSYKEGSSFWGRAPQRGDPARKGIPAAKRLKRLRVMNAECGDGDLIGFGSITRAPWLRRRWCDSKSMWKTRGIPFSLKKASASSLCPGRQIWSLKQAKWPLDF